MATPAKTFRLAIIDDNRMVVNALAQNLQKNCEHCTVEAFYRLCDFDLKDYDFSGFDILIVDNEGIGTPETFKNGVDFLKKFAPEHNDKLIFHCTGLCDAEDRKALEALNVIVVDKGGDPAVLIDTINNWITSHKAIDGLKTCPVCGKEFERKNPRQMFCCQVCELTDRYNRETGSNESRAPQEYLDEHMKKTPEATIGELEEAHGWFENRFLQLGYYDAIANKCIGLVLELLKSAKPVSKRDWLPEDGKIVQWSDSQNPATTVGAADYADDAAHLCDVHNVYNKAVQMFPKKED